MGTATPVKNVHVTKQDLVTSLRRWGGSAGTAVLDDAEALQLTFELVKALSELSKTGSVAAMSNVASKLAEDNNAGARLRSGIQATSFVFSELDVTLATKMILNLKSPGAIAAASGFVLVEKTGIAVGLLPKNKKTAQCVSALMTVAGNVGVTAITGIGTGPLAILTIGALLASSANAVNTCSML